MPFVDERFRTLPEAAHRGVVGQVVRRLRGDGLGHAPARPLRRVRNARGRRAVRGVAGPRSPAAAQALRNRYEGSFDAFWEDFRSGRPVLSNATRPRSARGLGRCGGVLRRTRTAPSSCPSGSTPASSSPRCGSAGSRGIRCGWRRSTARHCAPRAAIWIDAGRNDEYLLDLGAVAFRAGGRAMPASARTIGRASSSSRERTAARTGATRSASPSWPSGSHEPRGVEGPRRYVR